MILHQAHNRKNAWGGVRYGTLCGRMNKRNSDGMNVALEGQAVTCKFCLAALSRRGLVVKEA